MEIPYHHDGSADHEIAQLRGKVAARYLEWLPHLNTPRPHPLSVVIPEPVAQWERLEAPEGYSR
ncbi:hypothetical protein CP877_01015 [Cutibacterium modestum]|nr:hypothetical protein CP877_01015 [Cutibacterium modestum]